MPSKKMVAVARRVGVNLTCSCGGLDGQHVPKCRKLALELVVRRYGVSYWQEMISCGNRKCRRCRRGRLAHGPYWYAYWWEKNRTRTIYVGKVLPEAARAMGATIVPFDPKARRAARR